MYLLYIDDSGAHGLIQGNHAYVLAGLAVHEDDAANLQRALAAMLARHLPDRKTAGAHELHTTGLHRHDCDFQMFYVLKGWIKFVYEGQGEHTFHAGDCVLQPPNIVHNELDCSDDLEVLEIYSPAVHPTVVVEKMPEAAAAAH